MDRAPEVRDVAGIGEPALTALRLSLAPVHTLADLLEWGRVQDPPTAVDEIVTQDEYTHDVLVSMQFPLWLAFDVT